MNLFETYDPHVVGDVVEIWRRDDRVWRARIENACRKNGVVAAELEFTHAAGERAELEHPRPTKRRRTASTEETWEDDDGLDPIACIRPSRCWKECAGEGCRPDDYDWM